VFEKKKETLVKERKNFFWKMMERRRIRLVFFAEPVRVEPTRSLNRFSLLPIQAFSKTQRV
jgi:hypothetical protein